MSISDTPPAHVPAWFVAASTALLGFGVLCWDVTYVLMTRRSLQTRSYGMPVLALAINLSWEIVYIFAVIDNLLEFAGFLFWLVLDIGLVYTTVRFAPVEWAGTSSFVGRNMSAILALMVLVGCAGNYAFAAWWLATPGTGSGDKAGKWWRGQEGYDQQELSFWSAGVAQLAGSAGSLAMLVIRGHSGGASYAIWLSRFLGSMFGLWINCGFAWWFWPENHGFFVNPLGLFIMSTSILCDLAYPLVLSAVRKTEKALPDGRLVAGDDTNAARKKTL